MLRTTLSGLVGVLSLCAACSSSVAPADGGADVFDVPRTDAARDSGLMLPRACRPTVRHSTHTVEFAIRPEIHFVGTGGVIEDGEYDLIADETTVPRDGLRARLIAPDTGVLSIHGNRFEELVEDSVSGSWFVRGTVERTGNILKFHLECPTPDDWEAQYTVQGNELLRGGDVAGVSFFQRFVRRAP